jgi:hypothetical protein
MNPRTPKTSIDHLVGRATSRERWKTADSLSGSAFERLLIEGQPFVLKYLHVDDDWIQRVQGDLWTRPLTMWRTGLFDVLPPCLDHTIADVAAGFGRNGWGTGILMRDVSPWMVQVTDGSIAIDQHLRFIDHMAELHASFWGFEDTFGLQSLSTRYFMLAPLMGAVEAERGDPDPVPSMVIGGWKRMVETSPTLGKILLPLLDAPWPLIDAQQRTPHTLIHSDWKAGNLGSHPDGRTVLIDWAFPGQAPATLDLSWYLAVNSDLLPQSKEDVIAAYKEALEKRGIEVATWWDEQLELSLLAAALLLGWSKTGDELAWWEDRVPRAVRYLAS